MARVDLREFDKPLDTVILLDGSEVPVYEADAGVFDLNIEWQQTHDPQLMKAITARLLKTAKPEQLQSLTTSMMTMVVKMGCGQAAEVYALLGESSAPEATAIASRRSDPETKSGPSASG